MDEEDRKAFVEENVEKNLFIFFNDFQVDATTGCINREELVAKLQELDSEFRCITREEMALFEMGLNPNAQQNQQISFHEFCQIILHWHQIAPTSLQQYFEHFFPTDEQGDLLTCFNLSEQLTSSSSSASAKLSSPSSSAANVVDLTDILRKYHLQKGLEQHDSDKLPMSNPSSSPTTAASVPSPSAAIVDPAIATTTSTTTTTTSNNSSSITVAKSFFAGGFAGIVSKSCLAPIDRVKIMFQVSAESKKFSIKNAFHLGQSIYQRDGFRALFRGNSATVLRVMPYAGIQHSSFDYFRRQCRKYNDRLSPEGAVRQAKLSNTQLIASGSLAGGLSVILTYPLDVVRARLIVQSGQLTYPEIIGSVFHMYKTEGLASFSRGLFPTLLGSLPYTGIGFTLNESFKHLMIDFRTTHYGFEDREHPRNLPALPKFFCSYFAACIAQSVTYPLDTIRRRIQTYGYISKNSEQRARCIGMRQTAAIIMKNEGWRGFYTGLSVNWMRSPLATGISLTAYDVIKDILDVEKV